MQQNMINHLQVMLRSKYPDLKIDYGEMVRISDKSRYDTVNALAQQYQRFRQAAPISITPQTPVPHEYTELYNYSMPKYTVPSYPIPKHQSPGFIHPETPVPGSPMPSRPVSPATQFRNWTFPSPGTSKGGSRSPNQDSGYSSAATSDAGDTSSPWHAPYSPSHDRNPGFCPGAIRLQSDDRFLVPDVWTCGFCQKTFALRGDPVDMMSATSQGLEGMHPAFWFKQHVIAGGQQWQRCTICFELQGVVTDLMTVPQWNHHINQHFLRDGYEMCRDGKGIMQRRSQCGKAPYYCEKIHAGVQ